MSFILALAGSNSSTSINAKLLDYTCSLIEDNTVKILDLKYYNIPIYSIDIEKEQGIPEGINELYKIFKDYDNIIIAANEHNWSISAFFKNILDWLSRRDSKFLDHKNIMILSTSPGRGGAQLANKYLRDMLPRFGANIASSFSLTSFNHSFSEEKGIHDTKQNQGLRSALETFLNFI